MRASRLVSILLLLQARGRATAAELAGELEVSPRTIYRDVEALSAAGIPVYADRGRDGGYRLVDGYRTRLTGLTGGEADALFLSGLPGPAAQLGLGGAVAAAQLKLLAALSPVSRERAEAFRARFHLDVPGWFRAAEEVPHLTGVAAAVWEQRLLRVRYERWTGEVTRLLAPLGLVLKAGSWYVVATVDPGGDPRTYRVARILDLEVSDETFDRPAGFDLAAYWREWSARYERDVYRDEAVLRLSPAAVRLLPGWWGPVAAEAAARTAGPPDAAGWVRARVPIETVEHATAQVLRLGAGVEVLAPARLRERVAAHAAAMVALYRGGSADVEQVDDEDERLARLDDAAGAAVAVAQVRRDGQLPAAADAHPGHAPVPAGDDLPPAQPEAERVVAAPGRVELAACGVGDPDVVHGDPLPGPGLGTVAHDEVLDDQVRGSGSGGHGDVRLAQGHDAIVVTRPAGAGRAPRRHPGELRIQATP